MAVQSTPAVFALALRDQLNTRFAASALSTVRVELVAAPDTSSTDVVTLITGPVEGEQTYAAMKVRYDAYTLPGQIQTYATGANPDTTLQTAWARAALILDEIILELQQNPPQVGINTEETRVSEISYLPAPADQGGWFVRCSFQVEYRALVT